MDDRRRTPARVTVIDDVRKFTNKVRDWEDYYTFDRSMASADKPRTND
ncbi:MAG TPA: hypothetical protein VFV02_15205 [Acidimicrobiales bacterium]|nr:hypothetical protein [Acidimicrobiales bacterium]